MSPGICNPLEYTLIYITCNTVQYIVIMVSKETYSFFLLQKFRDFINLTVVSNDIT